MDKIHCPTEDCNFFLTWKGCSSDRMTQYYECDTHNKRYGGCGKRFKAVFSEIQSMRIDKKGRD